MFWAIIITFIATMIFSSLVAAILYSIGDRELLEKAFLPIGFIIARILLFLPVKIWLHFSQINHPLFKYGNVRPKDYMSFWETLKTKNSNIVRVVNKRYEERLAQE